ncbi:NACHT, LRR and PYD domains-containing protein 3-like [Triplophysa dalaica]|uniref:NACHT, LRR and PYD domains-containing protein 3-like n=1 Tax=Triplophysa dalaica TaxID=1582913 RepID=UPI0024DFC3AE|nr:NACHT, LRR and PYD domains-containing protein 3-like [Triplophysa dalaica]
MMENRESVDSEIKHSERETQKTPPSSPEPSDVSQKNVFTDLSDESVSSEPLSDSQRGASPEPSVVSMKSDTSIHHPTTRGHGSVSSDSLSNIECKDDVSADMQQDSHHESVDDVLQRVKDKHKSIMKNKYESLFEGIKQQENQTLLKRIYTQLYIIEGEREGVNEEHEVLHMERKPRRTQELQDTPIYCNDIFKPQSHQRHKIKIVLTKGIAGIGKTVSVQKVILDWAEGTANQDVDFMFLLPFRELNLIREHRYSLHQLLLDFHPELQDVDSQVYEECKVVFIFDGLDESRMTLMFSDQSEKVSDVTVASSVAVLMSNLMKGDLLPSALIWITSRPAAAHQIPSKYISRVTEIQGFNNAQKEEYFRKRISDEHQASRIMSHIKRARSLHIMCHIPVFCWISSTVLQKILTQDHSEEIPKTLSEMYIHFLLIQMKMKNEKYDQERDSEKEVIVKLAEVAFKQLMKGNVMFYKEDLRECGIDINDAALYSGICTEIFKEESVFHQRKIYSFIHLSFQEFLAALYVLYCHLMKKNTESLRLLLNEKYDYYISRSEEISLYWLLRLAVDKAVESETGHFDLFLRFLLGISLESNQRLLQDLLTHTHNSPGNISKITDYIKYKIKNNDDKYLSSERSINLFLCLSELNDQTLNREIEEFVRSYKHSDEKLSDAHCSTIAYMLQMSEEVMDEFDLKKYNTSQEGRRRLIPAVINCTRALLSRCNLTDDCCESLSSCLQSSKCPLRELDLSINDLKDSGVKLISDALKTENCQLQTLRLSGCNVTEECCESLSSCLQSSKSLRELDLSNNDLKDSGVKLISDALKTQNSQLHTLRLSGCNLTGECCESLSSCLQSSKSLRELDLSNNDLKDSGVKLISDALKTHNCQLEILRLSGCMVTVEGCCSLASALSSNPSHLRELDLSYNHPQHSTLQLLAYQNDPNYTLNKLNVSHGGERRITAGLHKYVCDLTLDPNTANTKLILSEENRKITGVRKRQSYPDHPDRFDRPQVLCRESLTGRCYWEAEWSGSAIYISVSYKSINRKGTSDDNNNMFGFNVNSWSLSCSDDNFTALHNKNRAVIEVSSGVCKRVGVYVDWSAGTLSFYSVSDTHTLTHLHTFYTTFTEPLCAGFHVFSNSSVSLCDINSLYKEPPVKMKRESHKTRFSKANDQNIHPLLNCQSCISIVDSDQWVQTEPSICTDEDMSKFRVSTEPGRYECIRTRMRWVCDCDVTLQYHVVDPRSFNAQLENLQCNRVGPVIDVTVISGELEEVHLPHCVCLGNDDPSLKDAVKALSIKDEGTYEEPVQLTRYHAKIVHPSFSLKTLITRLKRRWNEHCDLLMYMSCKDPLILHVYFFPFDDHFKNAVEEKEKSSYAIEHPRPDKALRMETAHFLKVPGASVHPKEGITLRRDIIPNFFKVKTRLENDLEMTLIRDGEPNTVWTAVIEKDELDQINPKKDELRLFLKSDEDKAAFFDDHFSDLIQRVTNVKIIADQLLQQNMIHQEQYSEITHDTLTSADSMRKLCSDIKRSNNVTVKAKLITILQNEKLYDFSTFV